MSVCGVTSITPSDPRYPDLVRGNNQRWVGSPRQVLLPIDSYAVADCVAALAGKRHVTVRSGGHCYQNHVFNPDVAAVIDLRELNFIEHDETDDVISIGAGATLWDVYATLHRRWGVTLPGGSCATVGVGGHIVGGGYGLLSRKLGLTVDYLHGVELVTAAGETTLVTRTSGAPEDRELWWAHTGGGGGNFGVVTRYLLRDPRAAAGETPDGLLPAAPSLVLLHEVTLTWDQLGRHGGRLAVLLRRYSDWCAHHQSPRSPTSDLFALLRVFPRHAPDARAVTLTTQVAITTDSPTDIAQAHDTLATFLCAILPVRADDTWLELPWLAATHRLGQGTGNYRGDYKSAYHRRLTDHHIGALVDTFGRAGCGSDGARVALDTYGGQVNTVARDATAAPHRDSVLKLQYQTYWTDPETDGPHAQWLRRAYTEIYAETGGYPHATNDDRDEPTDGCFVNYLDADLPAEGTPTWWELYYGAETFARLQEVKGRVDPGNVFRHAQSIPLPA